MKSLRIAAVALARAGPGRLRRRPAHAADASVSILHAVPGATVDVYANGKVLLTNFKPGTLTNPLMIPAGTYDLKVTKAGAGAGGARSSRPRGRGAGDANITVVAHLDANGKRCSRPTSTTRPRSPPARRASPYVTTPRPQQSTCAPTAPWRSRASPTPARAKAVLPAGTIKADVVLAGTSTVVLGPASLNLKEGTNTIVYAWGSAADKNLALAVQTLSGMHSAPGGVPAGGAVRPRQPSRRRGRALRRRRRCRSCRRRARLCVAAPGHRPPLTQGHEPHERTGHAPIHRRRAGPPPPARAGPFRGVAAAVAAALLAGWARPG